MAFPLTTSTTDSILPAGYQGSDQPVASQQASHRANPIDNPPTFAALPMGIASPVDLAGEWFVAQVNYQQERRLAEALSKAGIGFFVPLIEVLKRDEARRLRRRMIVPLLPGYVFVCTGPAQDAYTPMKKSGVYHTLDINDQGRFVREIVQLHRATESGQRLNLYPHVAEGRRCRITDGPLKGLECIVMTRDDKDIVLLQVSILGQSIAVEDVPIEHLEAAD